MAVGTALITAEEFSAMDLEFPAELVRGEIIEMPRPDLRHGQACGNVGVPLSNWAREGKRGFVIFNDSGVVTERDPDTVRGPDVMFIPWDRVPGGRLPSGLSDLVPSLVAEIMSPSDRWKQLLRKIAEYLESGVSEVWVIEPRKRLVHIYRPDDEPTILNENDVIRSETVLSGFEWPVREFFVGV